MGVRKSDAAPTATAIRNGSGLSPSWRAMLAPTGATISTVAALLRNGVAAMATGIARAAFEFATNYSKERIQFGVPIAMHQAIQFMIADMSTKVHLSRLATWHSAVLLDQGRRNTLESSHAKRFAADAAMEVTTDAVQVYGGYGFIKDYPVEKLMRDAKIMQLYEGTSQIQRLVIARETLMPHPAETPAEPELLAAAA